MEYVIGAVVFLVIFFAGGKYMQIKAEKAAGHVMEDKPHRKAKEETL